MLSGRRVQSTSSGAALHEMQPGLLLGGAGSCSAPFLPLPICPWIARQPFQASRQELDRHGSAALRPPALLGTPFAGPLRRGAREGASTGD